jgi:hypothetical protein
MLLAVLITLACGPGLYDDNEFPGLFMPASGRTPAGAEPYYYSPAFLYTGFYDYWDVEPDYTGDPVLEGWKKFLGIAATDSAAAALVYQGKDDEASPLYRAIRSRPAAWNYLVTARRIQDASAAGGTLWEPTPADTAVMTSCYHEVLDSMGSDQDRFLKDKYAFQAIKLAHLLRHPDSAVALYDRYFGKRTDPSVMRYWSLSHVAGALLDMGDSARGVYLFSQIFHDCPTRRKQAYMSLRLRGLRFIPGALSYCHSDSEKIAVYALCALQPWQEGLPLMEAMAAIDPNTSYLELIMGREINKNEDAYYSDPTYSAWRDTTGLASRQRRSASYFDRLGSFADARVSDSRTRDGAFWNTAAAYIAYVQKNYSGAGKYLRAAGEDSTTNPDLSRQILLEKLLVTVDESPEVTPRLEAGVLPLIDSLRSPENFYENNALARASAHLAARYRNLSETSRAAAGTSWFSCNRSGGTPRNFAAAKALIFTVLPSGSDYMSSPDQDAIMDTTSDVVVDSAIAFFAQKTPSSTDSMLMTMSGLNLDYLYLVKGRRALARFRYAEAARAWRHVSDSVWGQEPFLTYLGANPFSQHLLDSHQPTPDDTVRYTPYQFARRMEALSSQAHAGDAALSAEAYYQMGLGAYNMSYFGNSWLLVKRYWSSAEMSYDFRKNERPIDSVNYYSTLKAEAYFDSAMTRTSDPELGAKACFMAARAEQNAFYQYAARKDALTILQGNGWGYGGNQARQDSAKAILTGERAAHYQRYFRILKDRYPGTGLAAEAIRECATYRDFAEGK